MRINQFVARATGLSRRKADQAIIDGRVRINGVPAELGLQVEDTDIVELDQIRIIPGAAVTIAFNKPVGYVSSRTGQGNRTIYELLPEQYQALKTAGRLDKDSSGLIILSSDGELLQKLSHPAHSDSKVYEVMLDKALWADHKSQIESGQVQLSDGVSRFSLKSTSSNPEAWEVTMFEGRNRQIRRTFEQLGYQVRKLHRVSVGQYSLGDLEPGQTRLIH